MTKYAYVKSGLGTSTTDTTFTALQPEAFGAGAANLNATNCYADTVTAIANAALSSGDFICIASDSAESYTATTTITIPDGVIVVSVDTTDGSSYLKGAQILTNSGSYSLTIYNSNTDGGSSICFGVVFKSGNDLKPYGNGVYYRFIDCSFELGTAYYDIISLSSDGTYVELIDCNVKFNTIKSYFELSGGFKLFCSNLVIDTPANSLYIFRYNGNGGGNLIIEDSDFSALTLDNGIVAQRGDAEDVCYATLNRVKTGLNEPAYILTKTNLFFDFYSVGTNYHYFEHIRKQGKALESTAVNRSGGATYDGTNGFSVEFQPDSYVIEYKAPLRIKLTEKEVDLTGASGATLTFHLIQRNANTITALTDMECRLVLQYPDTTDNTIGAEVYSHSKDLFGTASNLTTSTETWTTPSDGANETKQYVSATIPQVTGMTKAPVTAYLEVSKDLTTADSATGELFVCPSPVVT